MLIKAIKLIKENFLITLAYLMIHTFFIITIIFIINIAMPISKFSLLFIIFIAMACIYGLHSIISFFFYIGYSYMLSETLKNRKATIQDFFKGIKKFILRILLAILILSAIYYVISMILSIILTPILLIFGFSFIEVLENTDIETKQQMTMFGIQEMPVIPEKMQLFFKTITLVLTGVYQLFLSFVAPLIVLWIPCMFIDDKGVKESLKCGYKAGKKKYWILALCTFILYLPFSTQVLFYDSIFSFDPVYYTSFLVMMIPQSILVIIYLAILFVIYNQYKNEQVENPLQEIQESE